MAPPGLAVTEDDATVVVLSDHERPLESHDEKDAPSSAEDELKLYKKRFELLDRVACAQAMHLRGESKVAVFNCLLDGLLKLMNSDYGFIGSVQYEADDSPFLLCHAFTNIAWTKASHAFCESRRNASGLKFSNMNNLWGVVITSKEPVISNDPANDPRSVGTPPGHPKVNAFLGIPFFKQEGELVGIVGIANKPGGYTEADLNYLEPFCMTCSSLIQSYRQQDENQRLINTLEESVQERTKKLQKANEELAAANKKVTQASEAQLQHFACMSHEIRTPLNCILGLSSLLLETPLSPMQEESLRMMVTSGNLLLTVVNDVLDFSKLESGNVDIRFRKENLQDTLSTVLRSIETKASEKNIALVMNCDTSVPPYMETDGRRLQQILYNLLGNAVKFSRENTQVELRISTIEKDDPEVQDSARASCSQKTGLDCRTESKVSCELPPEGCPHLTALASCEKLNETETDTFTADGAAPPAQHAPTKNYVRFEIVDYGKGIRDEDFHRIFEPFIQANDESESFFGGSGLGLAITNKLVKGLGGRISVASEVGSFTKFTLDLPLSEEYVVSPAQFRGELSKTCVMLVGSDKSTAARLEALSGAYGYNFVVLDDILECQRVLEKDRGLFQHTVVVADESIARKKHLYEQAKTLVDDYSVVLLTVGPKFDMTDASGHYRSILKIIPHVFAESILDHIRAKQMPGPEKEKEKSRQGAAEKYANLNVLIAEDNKVNQKVLTRLLKQIGVTRISVVDNGQKAVTACAEKNYDILLMDMQMPVLNGLDACRLILQSPKPSKPKIAFVTAQTCPSFQSECEEAGSSYFLAKPFNFKGLESLLSELS